jgi:hypothetical protein
MPRTMSCTRSSISFLSAKKQEMSSSDDEDDNVIEMKVPRKRKEFFFKKPSHHSGLQTSSIQIAGGGSRHDPSFDAKLKHLEQLEWLRRWPPQAVF